MTYWILFLNFANFVSSYVRFLLFYPQQFPIIFSLLKLCVSFTDKKAKRHTSSLPNLNRTSPGQPSSNSKTSPMSDGKKNRLKQPNNLPRKRSTATNNGNNKKIGTK